MFLDEIVDNINIRRFFADKLLVLFCEISGWRKGR